MLLLLSPVFACGDVSNADLLPSSQATLPIGAVVLIGQPDPDYEIPGVDTLINEMDLGQWTGVVMDLEPGEYGIEFQGLTRFITLDETLVPGDYQGDVVLVDSEVRLEAFDEQGCDVESVWVETTLALGAADGFGWTVQVRDTVSGRSFGYVELPPLVDVERDYTVVTESGEHDQMCLRMTVFDPLFEEHQTLDLDCVDIPVAEDEKRCSTGLGPTSLLLGGLAMLAIRSSGSRRRRS